jgi:hypothetical protein
MLDGPRDPNEMRRLIAAAAYGDARVDQKPVGLAGMSWCSVMIHNCVRAAEHRGLSGEDKYTMIAYHALIAYEKLSDIVQDYVRTNPQPLVMVKEPECPPKP